jgi:hypothetical protein
MRTSIGPDDVEVDGIWIGSTSKPVSCMSPLANAPITSEPETNGRHPRTVHDRDPRFPSTVLTRQTQGAHYGVAASTAS